MSQINRLEKPVHPDLEQLVENSAKLLILLAVLAVAVLAGLGRSNQGFRGRFKRQLKFKARPHPFLYPNS